MMASMKMPHTVYCGENAVEKLAELLQGRQKVVVFTDKGVQGSGTLDLLLQILRDAALEMEIFNDLPSEPTCDQAQEVADRFRASGADCIVAVGGGSVMDAAKLASLVTPDCTVRELLENPARGEKWVYTVMIPTTAGTGAEATPNSIVAVPEKQLKVGIVNESMIADAVLLDGRMIRNLPKSIAASTGVDALCHAIECYTSKKANAFSNLFAGEALKLIFKNLVQACEDKDAVEAKNEMLLAAFYAGVAITSSGTTAVHALSYPLGGKYHIPHGVSNGMLLMPVMRYNRDACHAQLLEVAGMLGHPDEADWVLDRMQAMLQRLEIPTKLTDFGVGKEDLDELVESGMAVQRLLVNNRREVTAADARTLYLEIMEDE